MQDKQTFKVTQQIRVFQLEDFKQEQDGHRSTCRTYYNEKVEAIVGAQLSKLVKDLTADQSLREEEDLESSQRG
jgi:hypothetical protein